MRSRLDPAITLKKGIERHHLFSKGYLKSVLGISDTKRVNQIAHFAFVDWVENIAISDLAPWMSICQPAFCLFPCPHILNLHGIRYD